MRQNATRAARFSTFFKAALSRSVQSARTPIMQANLVRQGNLAVLPDLTGGRAIMNTNQPDESVRKVFAETASYYVLGFQPETPVKPGMHAISVNVSRRDVQVVARTQWDARQY